MTQLRKMPMQAEQPPGPATQDAIRSVSLRHVRVPLKGQISDAKVLTGRQKPLTEVSVVTAEIEAESGHSGLGFSYTLRVGGPAMFAYAAELADGLIGEDPSDVARLWEKLAWRGATLGRSGLASQTLCCFDTALYDLKARRAGLPLAKLLGAHRDGVRVYNTSGQYLSSSIEQMKEAASASVARGIGAIKIKVGQPDPMEDLRRIEALRNHLPDEVQLMIDANQQWDRPQALRFCREVEEFGFAFIEEPLDARDYEGHGELAAAIATPIATGEMLTSFDELKQMMAARGADFLQADAPRIGGITPFLDVMSHAKAARIGLAPHFVMEIHLHLAAAYAVEGWVEHFEWIEPIFNERLEISDGRMHVPERPGLGLTLSDAAEGWTDERATIS